MTSKLLLIAVVALLFIHGAIHLLGTVVYLRLGEIEGFAFKTTVLGGRIDLGESGTRAFGAAWLLPAFGFAIAALALWVGSQWLMPILVASIVVSLLLTGADWTVAFMGACVDVAILSAMAASRYLGWVFP